MLKVRTGVPALLLFSALTSLHGQQVTGVTQTQAVIHYQAPNAADCQVKVSQNQSMTPLAYDVDPVLFPGSNLDSRAGSLISASKTDRYFVIGHKRADLASDGKHYSRALQAFSEYFYQVNCSGNIQSGRFVTANPPLGNDYPEPPPFDATSFGNYAWPTIDWSDQSKTYIDPMTGILLKRATGPGWFGLMQGGKTFGTAIDVNKLGTWTNTANILSGTSGTRATYSGPGGDPVFLAFNPDNLTDSGGGQIKGWAPGGVTLDNIMVRIYGTGSGVISGCLSDDSGNHCVSPAVNLVTLTSGGGNPAGTYPVACGSDSATGCFPNLGFWGGWNFTPTRGQMAAVGGTVNVSGSTVTAVSSSFFDLNWKPGSKVLIAGTSPACLSNLCTISQVNSSSTLTLLEVPGTVSGTSFKTANAGVMLWVNKGGGSYNASISANFDYAYSDQPTMPLNGTIAQCSSNPVTVSYAADGVTPITPVAGEMCLGAHQNGAGQFLYLLIPSTGETRYLAPLYFYNASDPAPDQIIAVTAIGAAFDSTDPYTIYVQASTQGGLSIFKGTYNAATAKFKAYSHSFYPSRDASYQPGEDTGVFWLGGAAWGDTGITWTNQTRASQANDINSQIVASDALLPSIKKQETGFDSTLFNAPTVTRVGTGRAFVANGPQSYGETIGLLHSFDLSTGKLVQSTTSYSDFPARWCAVHTDEFVDGWYALVCNPLGGGYGFQANPGITGIGPWQMTPTAVKKGGSFSSDTSMTATSPLDPCPTIPSSLASIVPVNPACVTFQSQMACSHTPHAGENVKWPCEYNALWSELQPVAPGDSLLVTGASGHPENLLVVSVTSLGGSNYQFTAVRGSTQSGYKTAANGWTGYVVPPTTDCDISNCTPGVGFWLKATDTGVTWRLDPGAFGSHSDLGRGPTPGAATFCLNGTCRFNIPMEQQIGTGFSTAKKFGDGSFAGLTGNMLLQGYPSIHQFTAPPSEQVWMLNYRHINPSLGAGTEVASDVGPVTYNLVSGTRGVFRFTAVNGGLHYKTLPVIAYAGYHLLQEVSSPAKGDIITDSTPWQFCVALNAGECHTGSAAGEVYLSVPSGLVRSSQNCVSNWYDDNYPCVFTPLAKAAFAVQEGVSKNDPNGMNWRRITMGFSGPGRQFEFSTFIPDPTGKWGFLEGYWLNGVRNDLMIAKLPPWPNPQDVTVNRTNFINQSVQVGASQNLPNARVRFGYTENGNASDFFCTARQEACVAAGAPYSFISESAGWQACTNGCTISVPAIPGRVLFYAVDRQDGAGNTVPGDTQVVVVR
ncbi:MAG TPA: hypothetical protein VHC90_20560 [Bryobacteraceae bacterium]|nr:hypothetical protein [Bryobacteraceae bacterium]